MPSVRAAVASVAKSIGATANGVGGNAAGASDVGSLSDHDLRMIIPIVMLVLGLLLAIVLRSLVAPLYLVASVALSYLASLGLAVLVFVVIGGQDGINFVLPFFMFVFIMALGQDYNILVMTRIREEAHRAPLREAVRRAVEATGTTVTSAGAHPRRHLRGAAPRPAGSQVQEIGSASAAGILLDTFFVRTLLVPSIVVLLGRWNWWPSHLSREDHEHDPYTPGSPGRAATTRVTARNVRRSVRPTPRRTTGVLPRPATRPALPAERTGAPPAVGPGPPPATVNERGRPEALPSAAHEDPPRAARRDTHHRERATGPRAADCTCRTRVERKRTPSQSGSPHSTVTARRLRSMPRRSSAPRRRLGPSPGGSVSGSAPSAGSSSATSASGPGPS